jgi:hypothetical protein
MPKRNIKHKKLKPIQKNVYPFNIQHNPNISILTTDARGKPHRIRLKRAKRIAEGK